MFNVTSLRSPSSSLLPETDAPWRTMAVAGLLSVGAGLSCYGDALAHKLRPGAPVAPWFWRGTLALVLVNAGLCLLVEAGKQSPRR